MGFGIVSFRAIVSLFLLYYMVGWSFEADTFDSGNNVQCNSDDCANFMQIIDVKENGDYGTSFYCNAVNPGTTDNVNRLSPFNVGVVAALGDSLTAALAADATNIINNFVEYKGLSWSIGGEKSLSKVTTLPNILKLFNPSVYGYSKREESYGSREALNRAVTGERISDLRSQAKDLVKKMKDKKKETANQWKVITIWIGSNDLCDDETCSKSIDSSVKTYMEDLHRGIQYLYDNVQMAFINLVLLIDVTILEPLQGPECTIIHGLACHCAIERNPSKASRVSKAINDQIIKEFVDSQPYERQDFTVVVQPFFANTTLPLKSNGTPDRSYFAPDCFHFSQKAHTISGAYLWNNMLQPVGSKNSYIMWDAKREIECPDPDFPYFRTNQNS